MKKLNQQELIAINGGTDTSGLTDELVALLIREAVKIIHKVAPQGPQV